MKNMCEHIESGCSQWLDTIIPTPLTPPFVKQRLVADTIRKIVHNGQLTIAMGGQVS